MIELIQAGLLLVTGALGLGLLAWAGFAQARVLSSSQPGRAPAKLPRRTRAAPRRVRGSVAFAPPPARSAPEAIE